MDALKMRILTDGRNLGNGILKVDGFINHQVDRHSWMPAAVSCRTPSNLRATKVLTAEISGIALPSPPRCTWHPDCLRRKTKPITMPNQVFLTLALPHQGRMVELIVSPNTFPKANACSSSTTSWPPARRSPGWLSWQAAGATVVGIGTVIEKTFEGGREFLKSLSVPIESLASIVDMSEGRILFAD
jgi:xanthine phosphoribosyltransferase